LSGLESKDEHLKVDGKEVELRLKLQNLQVSSDKIALPKYTYRQAIIKLLIWSLDFITIYFQYEEPQLSL
jgi:hypothetical protein